MCGQQDPTNGTRKVVQKLLRDKPMLEHHLEESIVTLWCPLHRNKALGLGHDKNTGLDLLCMPADHEKVEPEWAKEHPPATMTELHTSQSQLQPETLSVRCHKKTPTNNVPIPLPSWKDLRSSLLTLTRWTHPHPGDCSCSQGVEEKTTRTHQLTSQQAVKRMTNYLVMSI